MPESAAVALPPGCLPYGGTVVLRGVVERPKPGSAHAPTKKMHEKGAPPSKPAWSFELESPSCVGAPSKTDESVSVPVSRLLLMPIAGVSDGFESSAGKHVEATGVLVGLVSGGEVHVLFMVRELTPVEAGAD